MYACARDETTSKSFCPPVFDTVVRRVEIRGVVATLNLERNDTAIG